MYDLVLRDVEVVDGTGAPRRRADVAVEGGLIAAVGDVFGARTRRSLDGAGRVLAPGFIDLHTHADFTLPLAPRAESMVRQGVTTIVVGNCGFSPYPVAAEHVDLLRDYVAFFDAGLTWEWDDLAGYAAALEQLPLACDVVPLVGHGSVRIAVMGFEARDPTDAELERMKRLVADACVHGAFGLSTGLVYAPGSYAREPELVALAEVARRHGAFYASHIRGEGANLLAAVDEALAIGRKARVPVQLSHHKAMGRRNWGRVRE
jgi:N-acyl-D-amino-acid deacylase